MNLICFDLEGPLAPQDNAYDLMKLFPHGGKVFEVISRYGQCGSVRFWWSTEM
jgi:predicted HAD superfamily phosphohydrolase